MTAFTLMATTSGAKAVIANDAQILAQQIKSQQQVRQQQQQQLRQQQLSAAISMITPQQSPRGGAAVPTNSQGSTNDMDFNDFTIAMDVNEDEQRRRDDDDDEVEDK
jgi:hypothetical protein